MRKQLTRLMFLALLAFMPGWANADTYTVYGGTGQAPDSSRFIPLDFYNVDANYCRAQFVYSYSEVSTMNDKVITGLKFFGNTSSNGTNYQNIIVKVRLGVVSPAAFSSANWRSDMTQTTLFGKVSRSGNNVIISFNTGYYLNLDNSNNEHLVIELENVNKASGQYFGSPTRPFRCYGKNWSSNFSAYISNSSTYPVTATPTLSSFTPKCEFTYYSKDIEEPCVNWNCYGRTSHADEWISLNGNGRNVWIVGDSAGSRIQGSSHCLYVSGYPTLGNSYSNNSTSAFIYRYITLEPNTEYVVSYDWRCNGESSYDFMRVGLVSASVSLTTAGMTPGTSSTNWTSSSLPTGVIALDGGSKLNLQNSWQHKSIRIKTPASGTQYRFVVYWRNDNSTSNASAAAIDNITIMPIQQYAFHDDFEDSWIWDKWCWSTGAGYPFWGAGTDEHYSGTRSMYVGEDGGHNYGYTITETDTCMAFFPIRLKAGQYLISYNWKNEGESSGAYDYLRVGLTNYNNRVSAAFGLPSGNIACDGGSALYGQSSWQYKNVTVTVPTDTIYLFYLMWRNDGNGGSGNPAAVDNLSIVRVANSLPVSYTFDASNWENTVASNSTTPEKQYWVLANGAQINHWVRSGNGTTAAGGALHITNATTAYAYSISSTSTVFAHTPVQLSTGQYDISFEWKNIGENNYDYLLAALVPVTASNIDMAPGNYSVWNGSTLPTGAIGLSPKLSGHSTFQTLDTTVTISTAGVYRLVFMWRNDGNGGTGDPGSIDNVTIQEHQAVQQYTITTVANPTNGGTVTGGGPYNAGATCTLTATANEGYHFVQWQDGNTDNPRSFTVTGNATYTATFEANAANQYTISTASNNSEWGTVTGGGTFEDGATCTLTATASSGYHFVEWQDGNTENPRSFTVTENATYTATFAENDTPVERYTITVTSNNPDWGTVSGSGEYDANSVITISATANTGYHFVTWGDGVSTNPRSITVTADATYMAIFAEGAGIELVDNNTIALYPNPANNRTNLSFTGVTGDITIALHDMNGRTISEQTYSCDGDCKQQLDLTGLTPGAYFVTITAENQKVTKKLIVK